MRILVGVVLGFSSGCLLYVMAMMLIAGAEVRTEALPLTILLLFGGWAGSVWLLIRGAPSTGKVFSRGFLLGAAEWLAMIFAGAILAQKVRNPGSTGALATVVTGAFSFFMAVICLTCFAVYHFWTRTVKPDQ
jgi:threonine/homoserine/homoserine lactone efflux protein